MGGLFHFRGKIRALFTKPYRDTVSSIAPVSHVQGFDLTPFFTSAVLYVFDTKGRYAGPGHVLTSDVKVTCHGLCAVSRLSV